MLKRFHSFHSLRSLLNAFVAIAGAGAFFLGNYGSAACSFLAVIVIELMAIREVITQRNNTPCAPMSVERMHIEDLRALMAASIMADPNCSGDGGIRLTDGLLRKLKEKPFDPEEE